jgi:hypothetical protein
VTSLSGKIFSKVFILEIFIPLYLANTNFPESFIQSDRPLSFKNFVRGSFSTKDISTLFFNRD